jgi:hypothetical protein
VNRVRSHQWIDARSLALALETAAKLRRDRSLFDVAHANLRRWKAHLDPWPPALAEWEEILVGDHDHALRLLTEDSPRGTRLRQSSPFAGVLTAAERQAILDRYESIPA